MIKRERTRKARAAPLVAAAREEFLRHEAQLLDEARFDEWLALFGPEGAIRIAWKRVDLVNCDGSMDGITLPF